MIQQEEIIGTLCLKYGLSVKQITLCRDWIGQVYIIIAKDSQYVLKLYKKKTVEEILPSIEVVDYLYRQGFSVPRVIDTLEGELYTIICGNVAVLSEYIEGLEVERDSSLQQIGVLAGQMRYFMQDYSGSLPKQDHSHRQSLIKEGNAGCL
ncbi:MAG TPA: phosphotransferase [Lachnospiraceae bacterium]|nr:phosphotransferase [Lachnospiraceae bacterium]